MQEMTFEDFKEWSARQGAVVEKLPVRMEYNDGVARTRYMIALPESPNGRIALLSQVLLYCPSFSTFSGAATGLVDWAIAEENVMPLLYERARASYNLSDVSLGKLSLQFSGNELKEAMLFFGLFMIAGWDAFFVPVNAPFVLFCSNDDFLDVVVDRKSVV